MPPRRSPVADYLAYLAVRLVVCVIQALPWTTALALARLLAAVAWRLDRRHRTVAQENLRLAFPDLGYAAVRDLARAGYDHLATTLVETVRLPRVLHRHTADRYIDYANPGDYDRAVGWLRTGRPLLVVTGHFGNWEMFNYACGLLGFRGS